VGGKKHVKKGVVQTVRWFKKAEKKRGVGSPKKPKMVPKNKRRRSKIEIATKRKAGDE